MRLVVVDGSPTGRGEIVDLLEVDGASVVAFSEPRTAFLFVLSKLHELDGIVVNDDEGEWSSWLRARLACLETPIPVAAYSSRDPFWVPTVGVGEYDVGSGEAKPGVARRQCGSAGTQVLDDEVPVHQVLQEVLDVSARRNRWTEPKGSTMASRSAGGGLPPPLGRIERQ